jgi:hypothetical protein
MPPRLQYQLRRGSAALWAFRNPILANGEPGFASDVNNFKLGDGVSRWNDLPWYINNAVTNEAVMAALEEHAGSNTPHPIYDDGASFVLLYENAKV